MTNKEAIEILKELPDRIAVMLMPLDIDFDYKEALNLAIKTLEERPQGDLISRSVVKGMISDKSIPIKFEEETRGEWQYSSGVILSDIYNVIDNAPTVEITDYDTGYQDGLEDGLNDIRPQGEWGQCYENYKNGKFYRDCSICGKATITGDFNFCPYCGAAMQKGGAE